MSIQIKEMTNDELEKMLSDHRELNPDRPVRPDIVAALEAYAFQGLGLGNFLTAVVENNLFHALGCADSYNRATIHQIVSFIFNKLPASCWGSPEIVRAHYEKFVKNGDAS